MEINLTDERKKDLISLIQTYYLDERDEEISNFAAEELLDFILKKIAPTIYNQAINDAHAFIEEKLSDLAGDLHISENP